MKSIMSQKIARLSMAVVLVLAIMCVAFASLSKVDTKANAAWYSYTEGVNYAEYDSSVGLTVCFTVTDFDLDNLTSWAVMLVSDSVFNSATYDENHKFNDPGAMGENASYYFHIANSDSMQGAGTYTCTIGKDDYEKVNLDIYSGYTENGTKTLADVWDEQVWHVVIGPMFRYSTYYYAADYYVGDSASLTIDPKEIVFADFDGTVISSTLAADIANTIDVPDGYSTSAWTALGYTFEGWYSDVTKQTYSTSALEAMTPDSFVANVGVATFYAAYDKNLSEYIEFTATVQGEDDIVDSDDQKVTKVIDTLSEDYVTYEYSVTYVVSHNDGANSLLIIPEYDSTKFVLTSAVVNNTTVLGEADKTQGLIVDGFTRILWESDTKFDTTGDLMFTLTYEANKRKIDDGEYNFGIKVCPNVANDVSVAYYFLDQINKGEQQEIAVKCVYANKLNIVTVKDAEIYANDAEFTYCKTAVSVAAGSGSAPMTLYYTYIGDAEVAAIWQYGSAPINAGTYQLTLSAPATTLYRAAYKSVIVEIDPTPITVEIANKTSQYGDALVPLTYLVTSGTVYDGDTVVTLGTDALSTEPAIYDIVNTTNNNNYTITYSVQGKYTVTGRALTITALNQSAKYTGSEPTVDQSKYTVTHYNSATEQYDAAELPAGATVTLTKALGVDAGEYAISVSSDINTALYEVTYVPAVFTITSVAAGTEEIIAYFEGVTTTYNGLYQKLVACKSNTPEWVINHIVDSNNYYKRDAGTYDAIPVSLSFTAQEAANYTAGNTSINLTVDSAINKAALSLTADNKSVNYGDTPATLTYSTTGTLYQKAVDGDYHNEGTLVDDGMTVALSVYDDVTPITLATTTPVGVYDIVIGATNANYNVTLNDGTYTVVISDISDDDDDDVVDDASDDNLDLPGLKISVAADDVYYNRALAYTYKVMVGKVELVKDTDYTVKFYSDSECQTEVTPENAGTYYVKVSVSATANYVAASKVDSFVINKIQLAASTLTYNGAVVTLSAVTTDIGGVALKEGTTVTYTVNNAACNENREYTAVATSDGYDYVINSNNSNYLANNGTTAAVYGLTYAGGNHPLNASDPENIPAGAVAFAGEAVEVSDAVPALYGYTFLNWNDGTADYEAEDDVTLNANVTLNAIWNVAKFTVTFKYTDEAADLNIDKFEVEFDYMSKVTIPGNLNPVKTGSGIVYTYNNTWAYGDDVYAIDTEDDNALVLNEENIIVTAAIVVVAQYDEAYQTYTLTYYVATNEAHTQYVVLGESQNVTFGDALTNAPAITAKTWFKATAWYTNEALTAAAPATMPAADLDLYAGYIFDIGAGDVNGDGLVNSNDITLYRQWIVGGYEMTVVPAGSEFDTAYANNVRYFLPRVADINVDNSKDVRDVSITRMAIVGGYFWDKVTGENVTGAEIIRNALTASLNVVSDSLGAGRRVTLYDDIASKVDDLNITYAGNIYIDLNGKTLSLRTINLRSTTEGGTITLKNGTISVENNITVAAPAGNVVIEDVTTFVNGSKITLQAADSSLHFNGAVEFYKESIAEYQALVEQYQDNFDIATLNPAPLNIAEDTHVVVEQAAEIKIEKIVVIDKTNIAETVAVPTAAITLDNKTEVVVEVEGNVSNSIIDLASLTAAAANGGSYVLGADITTDSDVVITTEFALDLGGHNVTFNAGAGFSVYTHGIFTISGSGNVSTSEVCLFAADGGSITVNGGTYTSADNFVIGSNGTSGRGGNTFIVNGGTFNANITTANYIACGIYVANNDIVVVNGGTFNVTNGIGILARSGNTTVNGGTFNMLGANTISGWVGDKKLTIPTGYELVLDLASNYPGGDPALTNNSTYGVCAFVADMADINAVKNSVDAIALSADITTNYDNPVFFTKDIVLDLNGKTLTSTNDVALRVVNGAELTIVGNGNVIAQEACVMAFAGSTVIINDGTYTAYDNFVVGTNGLIENGNNVITINGGTFNGNIQTATYVACGIYVANNDTVTVNAGTFNVTNGVGVLARSGNTTIGENVVFNVTGNGTLGKVGDSNVTVPSGEVLVIDYAANYPGGDPALTNNGAYDVYALVETVADINAVQGNVKTIALGKNITTNGNAPVIFTNDVIFDLNGKTLTSTNDVALRVVNGAELTIVGNGNVIAQEACVMAFYASTVIINGGTYTSYDNFVVGTNGTTTKVVNNEVVPDDQGHNVITINAGTFNGNIQTATYVACGIYVANSDTVTVNAGTFNVTNGAGVLARSGNTTIGENVVFNVTGNGSLGKVGDSKVTVPSGAVLVLDLKANYPGGTPTLVNNTAYEVTTISAQ